MFYTRRLCGLQYTQRRNKRENNKKMSKRNIEIPEIRIFGWKSLKIYQGLTIVTHVQNKNKN